MPCLLLDLTVYDHVHQSMLFFNVLSLFSPVHAILKIHVCSPLVKCLSRILNTFLFFPIHATCPTHLILIDLWVLVVIHNFNQVQMYTEFCT